MDDLEREKQERNEEKSRYLQDKLPPLQLSGLSLGELQVTGFDIQTIFLNHPLVANEEAIKFRFW